MIPRIQKSQFQERLKDSKIVLVRGPKKCGKLPFIETSVSELNASSVVFNCDDKKTKKSIHELINSVEKDINFIVFNEAQHLHELQEIIEKSFAGEIDQSIIISCSFTPVIDELLIEALEGSGLIFDLFAPSFYEAAQHFGLPEEEKLLEDRLIFGNFPEVIANLEEAENTLKEFITEIINTNLGAKDRVNKGVKLRQMLQILAFELGEPISYNEVGERCGLDNETVERYIDLLVDAFVLIKIPSFHKEERYELKKAHCIYFQDNGIRNVLINNFNPTFVRNDMAQLWRNYVISERVKWLKMNRLNKDIYFWRTHTRQQIDFIEKGEKLMAYKTDWEKRKKVKIPALFESYYPEAKTSTLNRSTYWNFLSRKV